MTTSNMTPREIVSELDRYVIGQDAAKRAVAIALRNRWRRQQVEPPLRDEIVPKNIIMIGPTGVGKTEIARRLAKLANAPFIKVEASKFTEVGYVGKDVESMIRELTDLAIKMIREEEQARVAVKASEAAEERLLDLLLPNAPEPVFEQSDDDGIPDIATEKPPAAETRQKLRKMLREGKLDDRLVELESASRPAGPMPSIEVVAATSLEEMSSNLREMFSNLMPHGKKKKRMRVPEALESLQQEEAARLIDMESVTQQAIERVEQNGIVFLDEIDKIVTGKSESRHGPDVSREGVQRDILPIVEGSTVATKHGMVRTDHILFIAAGAFHSVKPADMIPELQGRFPIRVELRSLTKEDFLRILKEPENSLTKQYSAMMETEGMSLRFEDHALTELCEVAQEVNEQTEDIGARRLHTIMEKLLEEISFHAPEMGRKELSIDKDYVVKRLSDIVRDRDLSRYIL